MAEIAYPVLTQIEDIAEEGANIIADVALTAVLAEVSWLNLPVIKQVFVGIWNFSISRFYKGFRLIVDTSAIRLVNKIHDDQLDTEGVKLQAAALDFGINSAQFLKQKEIYREKFHAFARYGATLPPVK